MEVKLHQGEILDPWEPTSSEDLVNKLKTSGIWAQTETEKDGVTPIVWTDIKAEKLFRQFLKGERKFFENKDGFFTEVSIVRADVLYTEPETQKEFYLDSPFWESLVKTFDEDGLLISTATVEHGQKQDKPGVAGKLDNGEKYTPEKAIEGELAEELGLEPDQYEIDLVSDETREEETSKGFPKLRTVYKIFNKTVRVKPSGYTPEYTEVGKPIKKGNVEETEIQHFRWKEKL